MVLLGGSDGSTSGGLSAAVAVKEELGEENSVREVHDESEVGAEDEFLAIGALESGSGDDVDTDDHLGELERGEEDAPVGMDTNSSEGIVEVHESMNEEVHDGEGPAGAVVVVSDLIGIPAVQGSHDMVIVVKEDQRLLTENNEDGVTELEELGDVEEEDPASGRQIEAARIADDVDQRTSGEVVQELREGIVEANSGEHGKAEVPGEKSPAEIKGSAVSHDVLEVKSEYVMKSKELEAD